VSYFVCRESFLAQRMRMQCLDDEL